MDHDTTYIRDFTPYQVQPVVMVQPLERRPEKTGKLDTVPTYKGNRQVHTGDPAAKGNGPSGLASGAKPYPGGWAEAFLALLWCPARSRLEERDWFGAPWSTV